MKKFQGKWFIEEMELWDKDFIDMIAPGYLEVDIEGYGELRFGCVAGAIDCKISSWGGIREIRVFIRRRR